jgi:hypothetical protein
MSAQLRFDDLVRLLAPNIGMERAATAIQGAAAAVSLQEPLTQDQALAVLEHIAVEPGLVGITARFAKSRLILRR